MTAPRDGPLAPCARVLTRLCACSSSSFPTPAFAVRRAQVIKVKMAETMAVKIAFEERPHWIPPSQTANVATAEVLVLPRSQNPSGFRHVTYNKRDNKWSAKMFEGGHESLPGKLRHTG